MARISKGISQQELADKVDKTRPLISHIEQTGKVNNKTFDKICKALGVNEEWIQSINEDATGYHTSKQKDELHAKEVEILKSEIKFLKDFIASQKEIIAVLRTQLEKNESRKSGKKN